MGYSSSKSCCNTENPPAPGCLHRRSWQSDYG